MPCRSDYPDDDCSTATKKELDLVTRLLCELYQTTSRFKMKRSEELEDWWKKHQKFDLARQEKDLKVKEAALLGRHDQIHRLGGTPGAQLSREIRDVQKAIRDLHMGS